MSALLLLAALSAALVFGWMVGARAANQHHAVQDQIAEDTRAALVEGEADLACDEDAEVFQL